jgi:hypothetical protein
MPDKLNGSNKIDMSLVAVQVWNGSLVVLGLIKMLLKIEIPYNGIYFNYSY